MTRINFYVMSIDSQLAFYTGNSVLADKLTVLFTIVLPLGGAVGPSFYIILSYSPTHMSLKNRNPIHWNPS